MRRLTRAEVDEELERLGLMVQTERPLHEGAFSYLEPRGWGLTEEAPGRATLAWWKDLSGLRDPLWEGRGHQARAYAEARKMIAAARAAGRL